MKPFYEQRNRNIRSECNALKREMRQQIKLFPVKKSAIEIDEEIVEKVSKKYYPLSRHTIRCIWQDKRYGKKRRNHKQGEII